MPDGRMEHREERAQHHEEWAKRRDDRAGHRDEWAKHPEGQAKPLYACVPSLSLRRATPYERAG
jgi:hypothetical protein